MTAHYLAHVPPEAEEEHKQHRYDKQNNSLSKDLHHHRYTYLGSVCVLLKQLSFSST